MNLRHKARKTSGVPRLKSKHILDNLPDGCREVKPQHFTKYWWKSDSSSIYTIGQYGKLYKLNLVVKRNGYGTPYERTVSLMEVNGNNHDMINTQVAIVMNENIPKYLHRIHGTDAAYHIVSVKNRVALAKLQYELYVKKRSYKQRTNDEHKKNATSGSSGRS